MFATAKIEAKFTGLMRHAQEAQQTGKIYAYYRDDNVIHVGTLFFKKGRLCGANYDESRGADAVRGLAESVIATAMFVPTSPAELLDQPQMPDVDQVLNALGRGEAVGGTEHLSAVDLVQAVAGTLADLLGDRMGDKVKDLAHQTHAAKDLPAFREACITTAANLIGGKRARELLEPLFELAL